MLPQAPRPQTTNDYQTLFPKESEQKKVNADEQTVALFARSQELNAQIRTNEEELNKIKLHIMEKMQDAQELMYQGLLLATWKRPKASLRFDGKRFEREHPELFPSYQVPIANSRRLVIKESTVITPNKTPHSSFQED